MLDRIENIFRVEISPDYRLQVTSTVSNKNPMWKGDSFNTVFLTKEDALNLIGQLYELAESLSDEVSNEMKQWKSPQVPFEKGECLGEEELKEQKSLDYKKIYEKYGEDLDEKLQEDQEYDPLKDPKYIYQKELIRQVVIEILEDDGEIIKKVIKSLNRNPRLTTLINNKNFKL